MDPPKWSHQDARELAASHAEVHRLAEELRMLADEVPAAVFRCDASGSITFHNRRWDDLWPGRHLDRLHHAIHPGAHHELDTRLGRLAGGDTTRVQLEVLDVDGARVFALTCRCDGTALAGPRRIIGTIEDVTSTVRMRRESRHDQLTGLFNRTGLEERLEAALAEESGRDPAGVLRPRRVQDDQRRARPRCRRRGADPTRSPVGSRGTTH